MIVILCDSFEKACEYFQMFLEFLYDLEPQSVRQVFSECNCVETDDDLRYIFIYHRFLHDFLYLKPDILDADRFFEDITILYDF